MQDNRISLDGTWEFLHVADDRLSGPAEGSRDHGAKSLAGPVLRPAHAGRHRHLPQDDRDRRSVAA